MARHGAFITAVLPSKNRSECDLRSVFPISGVPLPAEEDSETYPYVWFSFDETKEFVLRVAKIRIEVNLLYPAPTPDIISSEEQWMQPTVLGIGDERDIPRSAFGSGILGASVPDTHPSLFVGSYKPSDQTFRMGFLYVTDLDHGAVGTVTSTTPGIQVDRGARGYIFMRRTPEGWQFLGKELYRDKNGQVAYR